MKDKEKLYSEEKVHIAMRLLLQDLMNDQSDIMAVSEKPTIWGGIFGESIKKNWQTFKKYLDMPLEEIDYKNL